MINIIQITGTLFPVVVEQCYFLSAVEQHEMMSIFNACPLLQRANAPARRANPPAQRSNTPARRFNAPVWERSRAACGASPTLN